VAARFIIGVDLGTTNTAVACVDTAAADLRVATFEVTQLVAPGETDPRRQLPSFIYLTGEHDLPAAETAVPWDRAPDGAARLIVGELARSLGARSPSKMIASAKSWLCHAAVDRHAPILPWGVDEPRKLSPVEASTRVLAHVREAWDHRHRRDPAARFVEQEVIVTVPASFDEAARELTLESARRAGFGPVVLLEEPQAAFYAWMNQRGPRKRLRAGENVLVFDVGGGTTDFTVIAVGAGGAGFERTAVGDHLLLGGDNIDLTLAKLIELRLHRSAVPLTGSASAAPDGQGAPRAPIMGKLAPLQWHGLVHACRLAKETLLANPDVAGLPITVSGTSSKVIGSTLRADLERRELEQVLLDGFFPEAGARELPRRSRSGLHEFGLPYAADPAITRHLAAFLARHQVGRIDAVLFNGGAMTPVALRRRVLAQIGRWQPEVGIPRELSSRTPALAVAHGAAHYGLVRRGLGARIGGGTPRTFYVGVGKLDGRQRAVCLAPKGLEEGATVELQRDFKLLTNRPVSFKLFSSTTRMDRAGAVIAWGLGGNDVRNDRGPEDPANLATDIIELPPIVTALRAPGRGEVTVHLEIRVSELGALEIWCAEPGDTVAGWRLSFDMRAGGAPARGETSEPAERAPAVLPPNVAVAQALLRRVFSAPGDDDLVRIVKLLEDTLALPRDEWPIATSRALFDAAFEVEEQRKRSAQHEARWLNLTGFGLRPGSGAALDDWRTKQMWRIFNEDLVHPRAEQCRLAWWIVWRRIAGGLGKGHQHQIYLRLAQLFLPGAKGRKKWDEVKPSPEEAGEMLRCLANLERISPEAKISLGDELLRRLESRKAREDTLNLWALARLGARLPLYGPLNCVVPAATVVAWLQPLLGWSWPQPAKVAFSIAQLARRTGDRGRDLDDESRLRTAAWLRQAGAMRAATLVEEVVALEAREEHMALGDTLPPGLRLATESDRPATPIEVEQPVGFQ
jgi:molecular chaperone DnaK (HSP70)